MAGRLFLQPAHPARACRYRKLGPPAGAGPALPAIRAPAPCSSSSSSSRRSKSSSRCGLMRARLSPQRPGRSVVVRGHVPPSGSHSSRRSTGQHLPQCPLHRWATRRRRCLTHREVGLPPAATGRKGIWMTCRAGPQGRWPRTQTEWRPPKSCSLAGEARRLGAVGHRTGAGSVGRGCSCWHPPALIIGWGYDTPERGCGSFGGWCVLLAADCPHGQHM